MLGEGGPGKDRRRCGSDGRVMTDLGKGAVTGFSNCYEDAARAEAYARLEFAGTYALAYRDLPGILAAHAPGPRALDFGCGTGRSTRFLRRLGFDVVGVDISEAMLGKAREADPGGDYRRVPEGDLGSFEGEAFDIVLAAFTFDNVPGPDKVAIFRELRRVLRHDGSLVLVASRPEIYTHEWASFSTREFPENRGARSGDTVRIVVTDHEDRRPVEDILWTDESYRAVFGEARLRVVTSVAPLASGDEPWAWVNEATVAPWVIYVLRGADPG
jgi:ubiquinone/menaquinone biosynthesis C-methylase UbiE